jgi:hypothetical protein
MDNTQNQNGSKWNGSAMTARLDNVRLLNDPILFVDASGDPKKNRVLCTVAHNHRNGDGRTDMAVVFWGIKNVANVCHFLKKGQAISCKGTLSSYDKQTGAMKNGQPETVRTNSLNVRGGDWTFGNTSKKDLVAYVADNLDELRKVGRMPANSDVTAEELVRFPKKGAAVPFDPAIHTQKYGNAKVILKGAPATAPAVGDAEASAELAALKAQIASGDLVPKGQAAAAADGGTDPFPG